MRIIFRIALRNVLQNRRRTVLIGVTLLLSCVLLLLSFALGNGIEEQILGQYRYFQSGDVTVVWENVKEYDVSDPSRLHFSEFKIHHNAENMKAIERLDTYLEDQKEMIQDFYKVYKGNGMLDTGDYASYSIIVGLDQREADFLLEQNMIHLSHGEMPFASKYGICISDTVALQNGIRLGDWIILDSNTVSGYVNSLEYQVTGLYESHSEFDSIYVYMTETDYLELFDQPSEYFHSVRIYLKDSDGAESFAGELDACLLEVSSVLRAESIDFSGAFYLMIAGFLKSFFTLFVVFILFVIAIGIRSVVRMNLFERMKEFGTLRAMGFNRWQSFLIIFLEILILALIFFGLALGITVVLVYLFGNNGIYIGKGAIAYILGGESIYPRFILTDTLTGLLIIAAFSLFAPLKPGLKLCCQDITHLLAQNQKPVSIIKGMIHSLFKQKRRFGATSCFKTLP